MNFNRHSPKVDTAYFAASESRQGHPYPVGVTRALVGPRRHRTLAVEATTAALCLLIGVVQQQASAKHIEAIATACTVHDASNAVHCLGIGICDWMIKISEHLAVPVIDRRY